ncbi:B3 domain-containing protein [Striga hermonthica]|uniref:B3 domain-containing protein n=1 Tax=Striga hermonthica TaxID=68872 RepID=A0A9N7N1N8_STRHE|nr:B3 domain-containing protein [Striga hermonthica]
MADTGSITANERRWNCLVELAAMLSEGRVRLEDLLSQLKSPSPLEGFSRKAKRSPRTGPKPADEKPESSSARIKIKFKNLQTGRPTNPNPNPIQLTSKKKPRFKIEDHVMMTRTVDPPDPGPAREFVDYIIENSGRPGSVVLVIEKKLFWSDVSPGHARLSVPGCQVKNRFLLEREAEKLKKSSTGIEAKLVQPNVRECGVELKLWESNSMYALIGGWMDIVATNELAVETCVRLWAYRTVDSDELCLVLEKIPKGLMN